MRIQTEAECISWLKIHGFQFVEGDVSKGRDGLVHLPEQGFREVFATPKDSWTLILLSYQLMKWLGETEILLWATCWSLYQEEEMDFSDAFRQLHGEKRQLIDAPGYLGDTTEKADAWAISEIVRFMLTFTWEGFVMRNDKSCILWLADGMIETFAEKQEKNDEIQNILFSLGISDPDKNDVSQLHTAPELSGIQRYDNAGNPLTAEKAHATLRRNPEADAQ